MTRQEEDYPVKYSMVYKFPITATDSPIRAARKMRKELTQARYFIDKTKPHRTRKHEITEFIKQPGNRLTLELVANLIDCGYYIRQDVSKFDQSKLMKEELTREQQRLEKGLLDTVEANCRQNQRLGIHITTLTDTLEERIRFAKTINFLPEKLEQKISPVCHVKLIQACVREERLCYSIPQALLAQLTPKSSAATYCMLADLKTRLNNALKHKELLLDTASAGRCIKTIKAAIKAYLNQPIDDFFFKLGQLAPWVTAQRDKSNRVIINSDFFPTIRLQLPGQPCELGRLEGTLQAIGAYFSTSNEARTCELCQEWMTQKGYNVTDLRLERTPNITHVEITVTTLYIKRQIKLSGATLLRLFEQAKAIPPPTRYYGLFSLTAGAFGQTAQPNRYPLPGKRMWHRWLNELKPQSTDQLAVACKDQSC
jgi:flagellar biosynthesis regulator FlaF